MSKASDAFQSLLKSDSAKYTLAEFLREQLQERTDSLLACNKETFECHKGRALELQHLLKLITK